MKASKFMDAHGLAAKETIPASRKLGRDDARAILEDSTRLVVAKGRKVDSFRSAAGKAEDEALDRMLGPTGNLRAPTLRTGKTTLVGFDEATWTDVLKVD